MFAPRLILPDITFKDSYADALAEGLEGKTSKDTIDWVREEFWDWLRADQDMNRRIVLPDGRETPRVPSTDYWLVLGQQFLGRVSLRHELSEYLEQKGGHIGYAVRPNARGHGYGHLLLKLVLPHAKALGLKRALITCADNNAASIRIIEKGGGKLQDTITVVGADQPVRRYWIDL